MAKIRYLWWGFILIMMQLELYGALVNTKLCFPRRPWFCETMVYEMVCPLQSRTNKKSGFPLCQTYKPTIILNKISKKMDQHTRGKWLIHGTKRRSDNQLQSLELPCRIS